MSKPTLPLDYRAGFEEAMANMFSSEHYYVEYLFYAHLIAQCKIIFDTTMQAPAGVNFQHDHYNLYINPCDIELKPNDAGEYPKDSNGNEIKVIQGFNNMPLTQRMGVLKHEMLHIINCHVIRKDDRNHEGFNIAADCAINQFINLQHLPDGCITPKSLSKAIHKPVPDKLTAEQYYELLPSDDKKGKGGTSGMSPMDDHSKWDESAGDKELSEDIAKSMLEKSISEAQKSRGNLPGEISDWLSNLTKKREVDWRQVFRRLVGNKPAHTRKTLMKPDRRLPNFNWIKGKKKARIGVPVIVGDESGSVSNDELTGAIAECLHICKTMSTNLWYVPVDTQAHTPHIIKSSDRSFKRVACGGTVLAPAVDKIKDARLECNALVVITDNGICESDIDAFDSLGVPVIWLITSQGGNFFPQQTQGRHKAFKLKA